MPTRRKFLATAAALPAAQAQSPAPSPQMLRPNHWGPSYYDAAEQQQLTDVIESRNPFRWYAKNSKVQQFEKEFAARMQTRYALAVSSGTAALQCALAALEVGPGDEVILPAWTWHSCFNTVVLAGALPVIAEVDESFNLDPAGIERHITPQTKVIMCVHLQGCPAQVDRIAEMARRHRLRLLEDFAQSVGASFRGRPLGGFGDIGICSLQQNKTITAGEGGAVITNDPVLFERASRFHDMGMLREPHRDTVGGQPRLDWFIGTNHRMNEFSGGVLLAQTRKLDRVVGDARRVAGRIYDGIRDLPGLEMRKRPDPDGDICTDVFLGFKGKEQRDRFLQLLTADGIVARGPSGSVILPLLPHIQKKVTVHPAWPSFNTPRGKAIEYGPDSCKQTVAVLNRFGGVPIDPKWTKAETDRIVAAIRKAWSAAAEPA